MNISNEREVIQMRYIIYYYHTFGCDLVYAKTKKEARRKALNILKKDFTSKEKQNMRSQGVPVTSGEKTFIFYQLSDLIEDIEIYNPKEEEE